MSRVTTLHTLLCTLYSVGVLVLRYSVKKELVMCRGFLISWIQSSKFDFFFRIYAHDSVLIKFLF